MAEEEKEKKSIEVIVGKKPEGDKNKYQRKEEAQKGSATEVGGRAFYRAVVICPYCGTLRNIEPTRDWYLYTCGYCGNDYWG